MVPSLPRPSRFAWTRNRSFWIGWAIFVLVVANCVWWARAIPFDGAPDESDHFDMVSFVARHGRLPMYGEEVFSVSMMNAMTHERYLGALDPAAMIARAQNGYRFVMRQSYLFTPQLPYLLSGWFCRILGGPSVFRARLWSALCIGLVAVCTYATGLALWGVAPAAVAALCVGAWPQMTFVGAYVNDDAVAILAVSILLLVCVRLERGSFQRTQAIVLGAALGFVASVKPYTLPILALAVAWFFLWSRRSDPGAWRRAWPAVLVAALLAGFWIVRNAALYDGDPTARRALTRHMQEYVAALPPEVAARTNLLFLKPDRARPDLVKLAVPWTQASLESLWGRFSWMSLRLPRAMYWTALAGVGAALLYGLFSRRRGAPDAIALRLFALPYFALLVVGSLFNTYQIDYQPQGRYLLSCVPALCLTMVRPAATPGRTTPWFLVALLSFFVGSNLLVRIAWLG